MRFFLSRSISRSFSLSLIRSLSSVLFHPTGSFQLLCLIHGTLVPAARRRCRHACAKHFFIGDSVREQQRQKLRFSFRRIVSPGCWFLCFNSLVHFNGFISYGCMYEMRATICFIWTEECPFGMHWFLILLLVVVVIVFDVVAVAVVFDVGHQSISPCLTRRTFTWMFAFFFRLASHACVCVCLDLSLSRSTAVVWYLFQFPNEFGLFLLLLLLHYIFSKKSRSHGWCRPQTSIQCIVARM